MAGGNPLELNQQRKTEEIRTGQMQDTAQARQNNMQQQQPPAQAQNKKNEKRPARKRRFGIFNKRKQEEIKEIKEETTTAKQEQKEAVDTYSQERKESFRQELIAKIAEEQNINPGAEFLGVLEKIREYAQMEPVKENAEECGQKLLEAIRAVQEFIENSSTKEEKTPAEQAELDHMKMYQALLESFSSGNLKVSNLSEPKLMNASYEAERNKIIDLSKQPLFAGEPNITEVQQGVVKNSRLATGLVNILMSDPMVIKNSMRDNGDTVTVRFYKKEERDNNVTMKEEYVTVSKKLEKLDLRKKENFFYGGLWAGVLEKAYELWGGNKNGNIVQALTKKMPTSWQAEKLDTKRDVTAVLANGALKVAQEKFDGFINLNPDTMYTENDVNEHMDEFKETAGHDNLTGLLNMEQETRKTLKKIFADGFSAVTDRVLKRYFVDNNSKGYEGKGYIQAKAPVSMEDIQNAINEVLTERVEEAVKKGQIDDEKYEGVVRGIIEGIINSLENDVRVQFSSCYKKYSAFAQKQFNDMQEALKNGALIQCNSNSTVEKTKSGLAKKHAYTVMDVYMKDDKKFVKLKNPWAKGALRYVRTVANGKETVRREQNKDSEASGIIELELNEFISNMQSTNIYQDSKILEPEQPALQETTVETNVMKEVKEENTDNSDQETEEVKETKEEVVVEEEKQETKEETAAAPEVTVEKKEETNTSNQGTEVTEEKKEEVVEEPIIEEIQETKEETIDTTPVTVETEKTEETKEEPIVSEQVTEEKKEEVVEEPIVEEIQETKEILKEEQEAEENTYFQERKEEIRQQLLNRTKSETYTKGRKKDFLLQLLNAFDEHLNGEYSAEFKNIMNKILEYAQIAPEVENAKESGEKLMEAKSMIQAYIADKLSDPDAPEDEELKTIKMYQKWFDSFSTGNLQVPEDYVEGFRGFGGLFRGWRAFRDESYPTDESDRIEGEPYVVDMSKQPLFVGEPNITELYQQCKGMKSEHVDQIVSILMSNPMAIKQAMCDNGNTITLREYQDVFDSTTGGRAEQYITITKNIRVENKQEEKEIYERGLWVVILKKWLKGRYAATPITGLLGTLPKTVYGGARVERMETPEYNEFAEKTFNEMKDTLEQGGPIQSSERYRETKNGERYEPSEYAIIDVYEDKKGKKFVKLKDTKVNADELRYVRTVGSDGQEAFQMEKPKNSAKNGVTELSLDKFLKNMDYIRLNKWYSEQEDAVFNELKGELEKGCNLLYRRRDLGSETESRYSVMEVYKKEGRKFVKLAKTKKVHSDDIKDTSMLLNKNDILELNKNASSSFFEVIDYTFEMELRNYLARKA